jgi:hypothetical protein
MKPAEINDSIIKQQEIRNQQVSDRVLHQDAIAFRSATILRREQEFGMWIVRVGASEIKASSLVSFGLAIGQTVFYYKPPNQAYGYIKASI